MHNRAVALLKDARDVLDDIMYRSDPLTDNEFGAWDVYPADAYRSAMYAEVLKEKDIEPVKDELEKIVPMKAAFDKNFAKRLDGDNVMEGKTRWEMVEQLREDIRRFKKEHNCSRIVVAWAASTEIYVPVYEPVHDKDCPPVLHSSHCLFHALLSKPLPARAHWRPGADSAHRVSPVRESAYKPPAGSCKLRGLRATHTSHAD